MNGTISRFRFQWMNVQDRLSSRTPPGHTPWLLIKTIIRGVTALLAFISLVCFAAAIPLWDRNLVHTAGPSRGDWQDGIPIASLALAFLYNLSTAIYTTKTAVRPPFAIEAIVDFLIWAVLIPGLLFATWGGVFNVWQKADDLDSGIIMCNSSPNFYSKECSPELYRIGMLELAGIAFAVPVLMMHIFLFAHGILERCRRPRLGQRTQRVKDLEGSTYANGYPRYS